MPFEFKPYEPPPLNNLRERLLKSQLDRLQQHQVSFERSLKEAEKRGLSPALKRLNASELDNIKAMSQSLRDGLETVKQQNAATTEANAELALQDKLGIHKRGFFRRPVSRVAAIEGLLERARKQSTPLTREAFARAQAIAASRRWYDPQTSQLRGSRGQSYDPAPKDFAPGYDPCVDQKRIRREVMFAQNTAGIGYGGSGRKRNPC